MGRIQKIVFDDFSRGMADSPDPNDLPANTAQLAVNIDVVTSPNSLRRAPGVSVYDFEDLLNEGKLPNGEHIISVGRLVYNKVWVGSDKRNVPMELVVIQVDGVHGVDWYELEREVGTNNWIFLHDANALFCGWTEGGAREYSSEFEGEFGVSRAGKIRYSEYNGVLRGACGAFINSDVLPSHPMYNKSDSFPLQWRYVNRWPINPADGEVQGYFKEFRTNNTDVGKCRKGFAGLVRGIGLPDYTPPTIGLQSHTYSSWGLSYVFPLFNNFGYQTANVKYVLLPEYDGHQIGELKIEAVTNQALVTNTPYYTWGSRLIISIPNYADDSAFPKRLSALRLYRSYQNLGVQTAGSTGATPGIYPPYDQIARFDIQDGQTNINTFDTITSLASPPPGDSITFKYYPVLAGATEWPTEIFDGLTMSFTDDAGTEFECEITSTTWDGEWLRFVLSTSSANFPSTTANKHYILTMNSRWIESGTAMQVSFVDMNLPQIASVPTWIEPNTKLDKLPIITCNYTKAITFKERNFVVDIAYDDVLEPTMLRYSNPTNASLAGFDIFTNYLIPPITRDDRIVCAANYLDYALVLTQKKIFKYLLTDGGINDQLIEVPFDLGIEAIDSYVEVDGVAYFLGRKGGVISWYVWNPNSGEPQNVGHAIRPTLDAILSQANMRSDLTVGLWLPQEQKYLMNFPVMNA